MDLALALRRVQAEDKAEKASLEARIAELRTRNANTVKEYEKGIARHEKARGVR